ncbi:hypothetical protein NE865_07600 [Phthorimaea operculella]|nr:hypothetical protein NE865_07600 [Phthorimaea operculella]
MMGVLLKFLGLCMLSLNVSVLFVSADDDEVDCIDISMEEFKKCQGTENSPIDFDVTVTVDDEGHGTFNGKIIVKEPIYTGAEISIAIFLKTPNGQELLYTAGGELCASMQDTSAIWAEFSEALMNKCPVDKGEYKIDDVKVVLDTMKPLMVQDNIGQYRIETTIKMTINTLMCVFLNAEIYEESRPKSECMNPSV